MVSALNEAKAKYQRAAQDRKDRVQMGIKKAMERQAERRQYIATLRQQLDTLEQGLGGGVRLRRHGDVDRSADQLRLSLERSRLFLLLLKTA